MDTVLHQTNIQSFWHVTLCVGSDWFLAFRKDRSANLNFLVYPRRQRHYDLSKRRESLTQRNSVTSQKTWAFTKAAVRNFNFWLSFKVATFLVIVLIFIMIFCTVLVHTFTFHLAFCTWPLGYKLSVNPRMSSQIWPSETHSPLWHRRDVPLKSTSFPVCPKAHDI